LSLLKSVPHDGLQLSGRNELRKAHAYELIQYLLGQSYATRLGMLAEFGVPPMVEAILCSEMESLTIEPDVG
jgi:hypothetical protein